MGNGNRAADFQGLAVALQLKHAVPAEQGHRRQNGKGQGAKHAKEKTATGQGRMRARQACSAQGLKGTGPTDSRARQGRASQERAGAATGGSKE